MDRATNRNLNLDGKIVIDFDSFFRNLRVFIDIEGWSRQEVPFYSNNFYDISPLHNTAPSISVSDIDSLDTIH